MTKRLFLLLGITLLAVIAIGCQKKESDKTTSMKLNTENLNTNASSIYEDTKQKNYTAEKGIAYSKIIESNEVIKSIVPGAYESEIKLPNENLTVKTKISIMNGKIYRIKVKVYDENNSLINDHYISLLSDDNRKQKIANGVIALNTYLEQIIKTQNYQQLESLSEDEWAYDVLIKAFDATISKALEKYTICTDIKNVNKIQAKSEKIKSIKDGEYTIQTKKDYENYFEILTLTISNGVIEKIKFSIVDGVKVFNEEYEKVFSKILYKEQCRKDLAGLKQYVSEVIAKQGMDDIDVITGATWSYDKLKYAYDKAIEDALNKQ
ncbi:MAG: hypothetical protein FH751_09995 [Firmicutes bacterium]|nr:hypothetical protein [Bacillota bacterium]